jgi:transposase InsO family protein
MIRLEDRQNLVQDIEQACARGARLAAACEVAGVDVRTVQRWRHGPGLSEGDARPRAHRPAPGHALTPVERERILAVANEPRFADMPPARIVPALADEGLYIASESSFSRVLRAAGQSRHRGRARAPRPSKAPTTHVARAPGEVWCWDMTYLPCDVSGRWFYLYLILDLYSRRVVGFEVHERDSADHAVAVLKRAALAEGLHGLAPEHRPVLHGDNGATLKATTVLATLHWLKIRPSYSRPRVSDDNAFVESLFRTAKYRPQFPASGGFKDLQAARQWACDFVHWYNHEHRHSGIRFVSPAQRHAGQDRQILAARDALYRQARQATPRRWSGKTRDWSPIGAVTLNPERECVVAAVGTGAAQISAVPT